MEKIKKTSKIKQEATYKCCIYSFMIKSNDPVLNECMEISRKSIQKYADKIGVDFIVKEDRTISIGYHLMKERLYAYELLKEYDRVLCLGLDIIIKDNASDIFIECPDMSKIYMLSEREHYTQYDKNWTDYWRIILQRHKKTPQHQITNKVNVTTQNYFNADVILCSKQNKVLFEDQGDWFDGQLGDQDYINYKIVKHNLYVECLPIQFNTIHGHVDYEGADKRYKKGMRAKAHFLHYSSPWEKIKLVEHWKDKI